MRRHVRAAQGGEVQQPHWVSCNDLFGSFSGRSKMCSADHLASSVKVFSKSVENSSSPQAAARSDSEGHRAQDGGRERCKACLHPFHVSGSMEADAHGRRDPIVRASSFCVVFRHAEFAKQDAQHVMQPTPARAYLESWQ